MKYGCGPVLVVFAAFFVTFFAVLGMCTFIEARLEPDCRPLRGAAVAAPSG
jgi:hypothetical protein